MADREYHFLIRVRGSTETFHFQITARNRFVALKQARLIPNLVECRAISSEELADLLKNEPVRDQSQRHEARLSNGLVIDVAPGDDRRNRQKANPRE
jgi:hypothetical protein